MKELRAIDLPVQRRKSPESSRRWQEIRDGFLRTGDGRTAQRLLFEFAADAVKQAWEASLRSALPLHSALIAAGGFGRGAMLPAAETEMVIVYEGHPPATWNDAISEFLQRLWDTGIAPNLRVLPAIECLTAKEQSFDLNLRLLDRSPIAGDAGFIAKLDGEFTGFYGRHGKWLAQRLAALTRERHAKFGNTPSHKEPNLRDTPGGWRDLRLIPRLQKLCPDRVTSTEGLDEAEALIGAIRCFLQYRSGEESNVLDPRAQADLAETFGRSVRLADVREYFRNARSVFREARYALDACESAGGTLIATFREAQSRFSNGEFTVSHERIYLRRPAELELDPEVIFRLLGFVAQHGIEPAADTERRLRGAADGLAAYCNERRQLWTEWKTILSRPYPAKALRALQNAGLVSAMFPEWSSIEDTIAADSEHAYTLDEHAIQTVGRASELRGNTEAAQKRFADLLSGTEEDAVLLFALLFASLPESAAEEAAARLGMSAAHQETVRYLVGHKASLSDAVRGRDLDDPATLRPLAAEIGTIERLRLLAVMTYAEISSTYTEPLAGVRLEQLWRSYLAIERELLRELETDRIEELPASLAGSADFIRGFPTRYLRARSAAEIEEHGRLYEESRPTGTAIRLDAAGGGAYSLTILSRDMPALFASFAGAISSFGLDIVRAEAFSNSKGIVLDTFVFTDPKRTLEMNPGEAERLQDLIRRVAAGKTDARRLLRGRIEPPGKRQGTAPRVEFDSEACDTATLVEIMADDRPGLLYSLATVFSTSCCNIDVVLIDTKGHRAVDVFYITQDGMKLSEEQQARLKQNLLLAC